MTTRTVSAHCPLRPGEPCTLCFPGATGPQDCGLVYLVRTDPELSEQLAERRRERRADADRRGRAPGDRATVDP